MDEVRDLTFRVLVFDSLLNRTVLENGIQAKHKRSVVSLI